MKRNSGIRICVGVVLLAMVACSMGCDANFAKGHGSLLETTLVLGRSSMSGRSTINPAWSDRNGPADNTSREGLVNPNVQQQHDGINGKAKQEKMGAESTFLMGQVFQKYPFVVLSMAVFAGVVIARNQKRRRA